MADAAEDFKGEWNEAHTGERGSKGKLENPGALMAWIGKNSTTKARGKAMAKARGKKSMKFTTKPKGKPPKYGVRQA
jgi:hypothetical protein